MNTWKCARCDTNNVMSASECEVCRGTERKSAAPPKTKPVPADPQLTAKVTQPAGPPVVARPAVPVRPVTRPAEVTPTAVAPPPAPSPPPPTPSVWAPRPPAPSPRSRPPAPAAYRRPGRRRIWTRRRKKVARLTGIGLAVLLFGPPLAEKMKYAEVPTAGHGSTAASGAPCPAATATWLPDGGSGSTLVAAYQTDKHLIMLCRTAGGQVYYDGQVKGKPADSDNHINLPATSTGAGWVARNGVYTYTIANGTVVVANSGRVVLSETLEPA